MIAIKSPCAIKFFFSEKLVETMLSKKLKYKKIHIQVGRSTCSCALRSYSWSRHPRCGMAWTDTDPPWSHSDDLIFGGMM